MSTRVHFYYHSKQKRLFDIVFSLFLLVTFCPIMLTIAITIILTSGWPFWFAQQRTGKDKKTFTMYKFRTMYKGADRDQNKFTTLNYAPWPMFKIDSDPRFTKIGSFLSKSGLDELPQLFNIFKGEMSFVGPRPLPVREAKKLRAIWDFRYQVKPGVFSEWTISDDRHKSLSKWRRLDKRTTERGGLSFEINILIKNAIKTVTNILALLS